MKLLGLIHITAGRKQPKLILNGNYFVCNRKYQKCTNWRCTYYLRTKCASRLKTTGNMVLVKGHHNHDCPTNVDYTNAVPKYVYLKNIF